MRTLVVTLLLAVASPTGLPARQETQTVRPATAAAAFEVDLWPGEGRPRLVAGTTTLLPRIEPRSDAATGTALQVKKGHVLEFGETRYRTIVSGRLEVTKDAEVKGRRLGPVRRLSREEYYSDRYPTEALPVRAGEVIEYLQPRAEGSCIVRIRGEIVDADPCPHVHGDPAAEFAVLEAEPKTEWWVQVLLKGRPEGWLLVDGKTVREEGRTF